MFGRLEGKQLFEQLDCHLHGFFEMGEVAPCEIALLNQFFS